MIKIKKSPAADSRTMVGTPSKSELLYSSWMHINDVREGLAFFAEALLDAGERHDHTKISGIDDFYDSYSKKLTGAEFKAEKWYQQHLTERHHLNDRCPEDVNLLDVLERVADIVMAGMGRSGEVYSDELSAEILQRAYKNTIDLLKKQIIVEG